MIFPPLQGPLHGAGVSKRRGPMSDREKTIIFVDDRDVMYRGGTKRVLHPLQRHPENPLRGIRPMSGTS